MHIIIAPDSFKGSLTSPQAGRAIERGIRRVYPEADCTRIAVADGGEGTVQALLEACGGRQVRKTVRGPARSRVTATYGVLADGRTAVIEMAAASGLTRLKGRRRDPLKTTTYGTGELLADALDRDLKRIIVGVGGSATVDGGAGMAQALGVRFHDASGRRIRAALAGGTLDRIAAIDTSHTHPALRGTEIVVAADVSNRLLGRRGAARVFGPQKGADAAAVRRLEANLAHYHDVVERCLGISVGRRPGAGAAGGLAAGLAAFTGADIESGIDVVLRMIKLDQRLRGADLVIAGEGRVDSQTGFGKAPLGVARAAGRRGVPVVVIGGALAEDARRLYRHGIAGLEAAVCRAMAPGLAMDHAASLLADAAERVMRAVRIGTTL